jgi:hypothetical protein
MTTAKTLLGTICCLGLMLAAPVSGDTLAYTVSVNTASVLTTPNTIGYIDFQLNPGSLGAAGVTAAVSGFGGATLSTVTNTSTTNLYFVDGEVSTSPASLPILLSSANTLIMMNGNADNQLTQALTFNTGQITFELTLSGPGVSLSGGAGSLSGTTFVLDFLNTAQSAYLLSSDPNGTSTSATDPLWAVGVIDISNRGLVTLIANPGPNGGPSVVAFTPVPEPSTWLLLGGGLLTIALVRKRRTSFRN